jgi:predicted GIY-YIG superfamily endonuclease
MRRALPDPPAGQDVSAYVYILCCADRSYYVGITRGTLETRLAEHQSGVFGGYTALRRPVRLVFHQRFERIEDAIAAERQIKGWRRAKKEALIRGEYDLLQELSKRGSGAAAPTVRPSRRGPAGRSSG